MMDRRKLLARLSMALGGIAAGLVAIPVLGSFFVPLLRRVPRRWYPVGEIDEFPVGTTNEVRFESPSPLPWSGLTAHTAAWLRREDASHFVAFAVNCTHLGCPVRWLPEARIFMCPCHGGVYYRDGTVAAGPPPRPLARYPVRVRDGKVEILTSPIPISA